MGNQRKLIKEPPLKDKVEDFSRKMRESLSKSSWRRVNEGGSRVGGGIVWSVADERVESGNVRWDPTC